MLLILMFWQEIPDERPSDVKFGTVDGTEGPLRRADFTIIRSVPYRHLSNFDISVPVGSDKETFYERSMPW